MTYFDNIQLQMIAAYTSDDLTAAFTPQSPGKKFRGEKSANEKQIKEPHFPRAAGERGLFCLNNPIFYRNSVVPR